MSWFMVDVETDGPAPGLFSMIEIGVVRVDEKMDTTFHAKMHPLPNASYDPNALLVSGYTHDQTMGFDTPYHAMSTLDLWVRANSPDQPRFISDNNGFDWQFVNYYFWRELNKNPFGHSSTNLGSLFKGLSRDMKKNFKHLRVTKHTHFPVDDAKGNVEALLTMRKMGLYFPL